MLHNIRLPIQRIHLRRRPKIPRVPRVIQHFTQRPVRRPTTPPPQDALPAFQLLYPVRDVAFADDQLGLGRYADLQVGSGGVAGAALGVARGEGVADVGGVAETAGEDEVGLGWLGLRGEEEGREGRTTDS
jgi:hypothetical protein